MKKHLSNKGWTKMRQLLDSEMPVANRKPFLIWWLSGAAVATILIFSIQYWAGRPEATELASTESTIVESGDIVKSEMPINQIQSKDTPTLTQENLAIAVNQSKTSIINRLTASSKNPTELNNVENSQLTSMKLASLDTPTGAIGKESQENKELGQYKIITEAQVPVSVLSDGMDSKLNQEGESSEFTEIDPINEFPNFESNDTPEVFIDGNMPNKLEASQPNNDRFTESSIQSLDGTNELASENKVSSIDGYVGLSSGVNIVDPISYVAQFGGGVSLAISQKWSVQIGAGLGLNGLSHQASIGLVTESSLAEDFQNNNVTGQSLPPGTEAAELSLTNNWFTYLNTGLQYRTGKWSFGTGVDLAYRFGIQLNGLSQRAFDANAMPAQRNFTGSEIEEIFTLYNRIDIRPVLSIGYMVHQRLSLDLVYRHGLNPLLKYPLSGSKAAYNRNIQIGLGYHF